MNPSKPLEPFPTFASLAEAEAYSDQTGDAYFEICYHLEGNLNLSLKAMIDLYARAPAGKRSKMQTGLVRKLVCPDGWPKHPQTIVSTLLACARYRHEDTAHAHGVREAMTALIMEKEYEGTMGNSAFDSRTFKPWAPADGEAARNDLLRLCDWIESRLHMGTHQMWYRAPDCFADDAETAHLAQLGMIQRHLGTFSDRDRKRWEGMLARAAAKHKGDLRKWGTVGKAQHDPQPRTWTHPEVDARIIGLWPLVLRFNWTYPDLQKVLEHLLPLSSGQSDRVYPLDSVESLKVHCRTVCGLTKTGKGRSTEGLPAGWKIADRLFSGTGK